MKKNQGNTSYRKVQDFACFRIPYMDALNLCTGIQSCGNTLTKEMVLLKIGASTKNPLAHVHVYCMHNIIRLKNFQNVLIIIF